MQTNKTIRGILFDIARRNVWPSPYTGRVLCNEFSERWRGREAELLRHHKEVTRHAAARDAGDLNTAAVIAGEVVDLITDIPPDGVFGRRFSADAVLRFRLMVKRGPCKWPQASGEAQHEALCRFGRFRQRNLDLYC